MMFTHIFESPCGPISIIFDENETLFHLDFPDQKGNRQERLFNKRFKSISLEEKAPNSIKNIILSYLNGDNLGFSGLKCDLGGTDFQRTVWHALKTIPYGQTLSYLGLATQLGNPKAVRAVAHANALNPISLVYPCHRVIGSDGSLTGYAGGLARKEWLLRLEGALLI